MYLNFFKRLLDIVISLILLVFLSPIMLFIFFIIWTNIGFPIFKQRRPGFKNKIYTLYKFKTLYDDSKKVSETSRQNNIGDFLRKTGLDELPQLINILKNEMSLVGPRPLLEEYLNKYTAYEKQRHLVKPGITGLAQIYPDPSGLKTWKKSIKLDIFYVKNVSFLLDLKIILRTVFLILSQKKQYKDFTKFYE